MFASERYEKLFNVSKNGTVSVDDNGKSAFVSGKGEHRLIYRATSEKEISETINEELSK